MALIVYDSDSKTEHFLRTAHFDAISADSGFIIPTPSRPELAEASRPKSEFGHIQ